MRKLILICSEDNCFLAQCMAQLADYDFDVCGTNTLREAQQRLQTMLPSLILLDAIHSDGSGIEFCERLKQHYALPIIMTSALPSTHETVEALHRGADDYIARPYELPILLARIDVQLRRSAMIPENLRIGVLSFNIPLSMAYIGDTMLNLTQKEYGVLLYLARNLGKIIHKQRLYRSVWGQELHSDSSALWSTVSRLKQKLEPYSEQIAIISTHEGYELRLLFGSPSIR